MKPARKRYMLETITVWSAYGIILAISQHFLHARWPAPQRYFIAITPVLPLLYFPFVFLRLFRALDELRQRIQLEAMAFTFAATAIFSFCYGFLQGEGMRKISWIWVYPIMCGFWVIGVQIAKRRYR